MKKLSDQIIKVIKPCLKTESKILIYRIFNSWEQIINPEFIYQATPFKLTKTKEGYILWIETYSNSIASFLYYQQNLIIEKISSFAAINNIKSIKIKISYTKKANYKKFSEEETKPSYLLPAYIREKIQKIEDNDISSALEKMSKHFLPIE